MNLDMSWYVIAGLIAVVIVGYLLVKRSRVPSGRNADLPAGALPPGWQFYSNPTTLEQPGTVFRIDPEGRKYNVDSLKVAIQSGPEAVASVEESVAANTGMVARFIGLPHIAANIAAQKTEDFVYEITDPVMEVVSDVELDKTLTPFLHGLEYRRGHRYFVIRQARQASAIRYRFTRKQVDSFGGEASVGEQLSAQGSVFSSDASGRYILEQAFKAPMRVMFLPEEIRPISAGLAAEKPRLGLMPVKEPLRWEDPPQANQAKV
jgi:hypothetical protein